MTKKYHPGQIFIFGSTFGSTFSLILSLKKLYSSRYDTKSLVVDNNGIEYLQTDFYPEYDKIII